MNTWITIKNFDNYEMKVDGTVRNKKTGRILKPYKVIINGNTYYKYSLYKNKKPVTKLRHCLIAENYIPNPNNLPEVDHIIPVKDGGTDVITNLHWVSKRKNQLNPLTVKRSRWYWDDPNNKETRRKKMLGNNYGELLGQPVVQLTKEGIPVFVWHSTREAERIGGFDHKSISNCCRGIKKTHHNFGWAYF